METIWISVRQLNLATTSCSLKLKNFFTLIDFLKYILDVFCIPPSHAIVMTDKFQDSCIADDKTAHSCYL